MDEVVNALEKLFQEEKTLKVTRDHKDHVGKRHNGDRAQTARGPQ